MVRLNRSATMSSTSAPMAATHKNARGPRRTRRRPFLSNLLRHKHTGKVGMAEGLASEKIYAYKELRLPLFTEVSKAKLVSKSPLTHEGMKLI